jgi:hypothetical protein
MREQVALRGVSEQEARRFVSLDMRSEGRGWSDGVVVVVRRGHGSLSGDECREIVREPFGAMDWRVDGLVDREVRRRAWTASH